MHPHTHAPGTVGASSGHIPGKEAGGANHSIRPHYGEAFAFAAARCAVKRSFCFHFHAFAFAFGSRAAVTHTFASARAWRFEPALRRQTHSCECGRKCR
eukprot:1144348-Alexandrium_andersonii.AAC.1